MSADEVIRIANNNNKRGEKRKMDVFAELLNPVLIDKMDSASKDRKQKNKYQKYALKNKKSDTNIQESEENAPLKVKVSEWTQVDRRSGNDRREKLNQRGRWLESRLKKDRRKNKKAVRLKV